MKTTLLILFTLLATTAVAHDYPDKLTLRQCLSIALNKNHDFRQAIYDHQIAVEKIKEAKSDLLPQVDASGYWTNNLGIPVMVLPGDLIGQPGQNIPVEFGSPYDMGASLQLNQVLFNPALFTGIRIARNAEELAALRSQYTVEELIYNVSAVYYDILHTMRQIECVEKNLTIQDSLYTLVGHRVSQDIAREIDQNRIKVGVSNLTVRKNQLQALHDQQVNYFNVLLGLPVGIRLILDEESLTQTIIYPQTAPDIKTKTELLLLDKEKEQAELNKKLISRQYLPTLTFVASAGYQYLSENMKLKSASWFDYSLIGVRLSIPLFDGLKKHRQHSQMNYTLMKIDEQISQTSKTIQAEYQNARRRFEVATLSVADRNDNLALARKIYRQSLLLYEEGLYSVTDLLQTETTFQEAQSAYWTEVNNQKKALLDVMKAEGNLEQLIH